MSRIGFAVAILTALPGLGLAQSRTHAQTQIQAQPPIDRRPAIRAAGACDDAEHQQFDFWVGRWQVSPTGQRKVVAGSIITKSYGGCAIVENWMPIGQPGGGSLSSYVRGEGVWKQTWVDSSGSRAEFIGGWNGQAMVLTGSWPLPDGRARIVRMTYTPNPDGSVRQAGEQSLDGGRSFQPSFDFTYRRPPPLTPGRPILPR